VTRTILVVDDEPDIRELARVSLEMVGGYQVVVAATGRAAVELIDSSAPDAVVLDVQMPGMDGPATLAALRGTTAGAQVPVVFLTASVQETQVAELRRLGAVGVLPKPFDPMTLPDQLRAVLAWSS
jgi:CheY-like chemotaxis protein